MSRMKTLIALLAVALVGVSIWFWVDHYALEQRLSTETTAVGSFVPLTQKQYQAEIAAGFSSQQIVQFEKIRKANQSPTPDYTAMLNNIMSEQQGKSTQPCPASDPAGLYTNCTATTTSSSTNPLGI